MHINTLEMSPSHVNICVRITEGHGRGKLQLNETRKQMYIPSLGETDQFHNTTSQEESINESIRLQLHKNTQRGRK
jgi:hypothetical protein